MDLFTHFLVPFIILTIIKSRYRLAGAFGGISIDFDTLFVSWIGILFPQLFIFSHRGITHSFFFAFFTTLIFLYVISRKRVNQFISNIIKRDISIEFNKISVIVAFFGGVIHLFLDFLTARGIPLFYPFSLTKYSAELYQNVDLITMIVAGIVMIIIYLKINPNYKKIAMTIFIIILVSFGGLRASEKLDVIESQTPTLNENYSKLTVYPTNDIYEWQVIQSNSPNSTYLVYNYNTNNREKTSLQYYNTPLITNGSYIDGIHAIKLANSNPLVQRFKWNSHYSLINASYTGKDWNITYYDIIDSYTDNSLSVKIM
jgi:inner membrane protein